jgi:hypothetical protein
VSARLPLIAGVLAVSVAVGCSPTTYDESAATPATEATSTTALVSNDPVEVLPVMLDEVASLAQRVVDNDGAGSAATRIEQMWAAIEPSVRDARPELVSGFDFVVRRCRDAADRKRPADADRAFKNMEALVESYLDV